MTRLAMLFALFPAAVWAQDACQDITVSDQVYDCSVQTLEHSEKQLNDAYQKLIAKVNHVYRDRDDDDLRNEYIIKIRDAQRAWIKFREKNCVIYAFQIETGRQAYEVSVNACASEMADKRSEELLFFYNML